MNTEQTRVNFKFTHIGTIDHGIDGADRYFELTYSPDQDELDDEALLDAAHDAAVEQFACESRGPGTVFVRVPRCNVALIGIKPVVKVCVRYDV